MKVFDSGAESEGEGARDDSAMDRLLRDVARAPERPLPIAPTEVTDRRVTGAIIADRYRLERRIGEGGMGTVWAARHTVTRKSVALKFLKTAPAEGSKVRQRFIREARTASAIDHPNVIRVHDVFDVDEGDPVIVMELLEGETFGAKLVREGRLTLTELAGIMLPVCSAVGKAHELGIVHRDLKPENIFLESAGETDRVRVKVLDFGIAKLTALEGDAARSAGDTATGALLGTPFYMSPEQIFGERDVDHRADIWALGIILYEALAGRRPTEAESVGQILKIITTDAIAPLRTLAPSTPPEVEDLIGRMLHRDRDRRPSDLREVFAILSAFSSETASTFGEPARAAQTPTEEPVSHPEARVRVASARPASTLDSAVSEPTKPATRSRPGRLAMVAYGLVAVGALTVWGAFLARPQNPMSPSAVTVGVGPLPTEAIPSGGASQETPSGGPASTAKPSARSSPKEVLVAPPESSGAAERATPRPSPTSAHPKPAPKAASSTHPAPPAPSSSNGTSAPAPSATHIDPGSYL